MEVLGSRYDLLTSHLNPRFPLLVLAFWTMTVTATVVADAYFTAFRTHLHMAAKQAGSAQSHCLERLANLWHGGIRVKKIVTPVPDDLPDLMLWPHPRRSCQSAKHSCVSPSLLRGGRSSWSVWSGGQDGLLRFGYPLHIPKDVLRRNGGACEW